MRFIRNLILIQALYILITAVWPIIDIESFMAVTGPKNDIWLVKTVAALLVPVSLTLLTFLKLSTDKRPAMILGFTTALAFLIIDVYYSLNDVISDIYLADAAAQTIFLAAWTYVVMTRYKQLNN